MSDPSFDLPLFPLPMVLFPGMNVQLNVRWPSQRAMLADALANGGRLGIILRREVRQPTMPPEWHRVGTMATVTELREGRGSRVFFVAQGEYRFHLRELLQEEPYAKGRVEPMGEEAAEVPSGLVDRTRQAFFDYLDVKSGLTGGWLHNWCREADGATLSYIVGRHVEAVSPVKQTLLEIPGHTQRLEKELELLAHDTELLRQAPRRHSIPWLPNPN